MNRITEICSWDGNLARTLTELTQFGCWKEAENFLNKNHHESKEHVLQYCLWACLIDYNLYEEYLSSVKQLLHSATEAAELIQILAAEKLDINNDWVHRISQALDECLEPIIMSGNSAAVVEICNKIPKHTRDRDLGMKAIYVLVLCYGVADGLSSGHVSTRESLKLLAAETAPGTQPKNLEAVVRIRTQIQHIWCNSILVSILPKGSETSQRLKITCLNLHKLSKDLENLDPDSLSFTDRYQMNQFITAYQWLEFFILVRLVYNGFVPDQFEVHAKIAALWDSFEAESRRWGLDRSLLYTWKLECIEQAADAFKWDSIDAKVDFFLREVEIASLNNANDVLSGFKSLLNHASQCISESQDQDKFSLKLHQIVWSTKDLSVESSLVAMKSCSNGDRGTLYFTEEIGDLLLSHSANKFRRKWVSSNAVLSWIGSIQSSRESLLTLRAKFADELLVDFDPVSFFYPPENLSSYQNRWIVLMRGLVGIDHLLCPGHLDPKVKLLITATTTELIRLSLRESDYQGSFNYLLEPLLFLYLETMLSEGFTEEWSEIDDGVALEALEVIKTVTSRVDICSVCPVIGLTIMLLELYLGNVECARRWIAQLQLKNIQALSLGWISSAFKNLWGIANERFGKIERDESRGGEERLFLLANFARTFGSGYVHQLFSSIREVIRDSIHQNDELEFSDYYDFEMFISPLAGPNGYLDPPPNSLEDHKLKIQRLFNSLLNSTEILAKFCLVFIRHKKPVSRSELAELFNRNEVAGPSLYRKAARCLGRAEEQDSILEFDFSTQKIDKRRAPIIQFPEKCEWTLSPEIREILLRKFND